MVVINRRPSKRFCPAGQLTRQGNQGWLRLNGSVSQEADARILAEQLWLRHQALQSAVLEPSTVVPLLHGSSCNDPDPDSWQERYRSTLERGLDLVDGGELHKLVLAVRQTMDLDAPFDPCRCCSDCDVSRPTAAAFYGNAARAMPSSRRPGTVAEPAGWMAAQ